MHIIASDREWKHYKLSKKEPDEPVKQRVKSAVTYKTTRVVCSPPPPLSAPSVLSLPQQSVKQPASSHVGQIGHVSQIEQVGPADQACQTAHVSVAGQNGNPKAQGAVRPKSETPKSSNPRSASPTKSQYFTVPKVQSTGVTHFRGPSIARSPSMSTVKDHSSGSSVRSLYASTIGSPNNAALKMESVASPRNQGARITRKTKNIEIHIK